MESFPAKVAQIEWEDDDNGRVLDLVVFDHTTVTPRERARYEAAYGASHGACVGDWMSGERARCTPEGQFIGKVLDGFASEDALLKTLDQFGQIQEAAWARTMAEAIRETLRQRLGDDEEGVAALKSPTYG